MKLIFRSILAINSQSLLVVVYLIKKGYTLPFLRQFSCHFSYLIYVLLTVIFTQLCLCLKHFLGRDELKGGIDSVEPVSNVHLPAWLGYFFVALGVESVETLIWVVILLFVFTFAYQGMLFNPMLWIFGYKYYYVTVENGMKLFVISKRVISSKDEWRFPHLRRINNFTYIEWRK